MRKLVILLLLLNGCTYISHTTATVKADKAKAKLYGNLNKGDVVLNRTMYFKFGF